jgi:hypothetical protein
MFDEIPELSKPRAARKQAWLGIGVSAVWLLLGAAMMARHKEFGWLLFAIWAFVLFTWIKRLVVASRDKNL